MSLTIAIDFDGTFTEAPELWEKFIHIAQQDGHDVVCVTARRNTYENQELLERAFAHFHLALPTVFCNLGSKLDEMKKQGVKVDIWIDDNPETLVRGH